MPALRPLLTGARSMDEPGGVVVNTGRGDSSSINSGASGGSTEDGFQVGLYRSRSNHVVSNFQHPSSETLSASLGSSTHEQLHYSIPTTPTTVTSVDELWNKRESPSFSALSSGLPDSVTKGKSDKELSDMGGFLPEFENGGHASIVVPPRMSADVSHTPTPPTTFQERKTERYFVEQELIQNGPDFMKWESENKHSSLDPKHQEDVRRSVSEHHDKLTTAPSSSDDTTHSLFDKSPKSRSRLARSTLGDYDENEWEEVVGLLQDLPSSHVPGSGGGEVAYNEQPSEEFFNVPVDNFDPEGESSLDLVNRTRSSPLVDTKDLHSRQVLVETREHNLLPPSPPSTCTSLYLNHHTKEELLDPVSHDPGSIIFTPSGFSRLSPNNEETLTKTSTSPEIIQGPHTNPENRHTLGLSDGVQDNSTKGDEVKGHYNIRDNVIKGRELRDNMIRGQTTQNTDVQAGLYTTSTNKVSSNSASHQQQPTSSQYTSSLQVLNDQVNVSNLVSSSHPHLSHSQPYPQLTGSLHPHPQAINNFKVHVSSSNICGSTSLSSLSSSTPPPAPALSPGLVRPVFQRPRGYALNRVGVSTPHVVGMRGREEEEGEGMPASTLVAEGTGSSTGHTHQGLGSTDRDNQFLEDWIDGF